MVFVMTIRSNKNKLKKLLAQMSKPDFTESKFFKKFKRRLERETDIEWGEQEALGELKRAIERVLHERKPIFTIDETEDEFVAILALSEVKDSGVKRISFADVSE